MSGLVKKELLTIWQRQNKKGLLFNVFLYVLCFIFLTKGFGLYTIVLGLSVGCCSIAVSLCEMDSKVNFDRYAIALPFSKKDIVKARYISTLLCTGIYLLIIMLVSVLHYVLYQTFTIDHYFMVILYASIVMIFCISFSILSTYMHGLNGGSVMILVLVILCIGGFLFVNLTDFDISYVFTINPYVLWSILYLITLLVFYSCYRISYKFYIRHHS